MVTISSRSHHPDDEPHQHREMATSFGSNAEQYDRSRPRYPRELAETVVTGLDGRTVLDVGIGTGISAETFRQVGCTVQGVDADARMAEVAQRRGFPVEIARFEDWEPVGHTFNVLVAGQTWHWIDPYVGARKAAAAVAPGGRVALFWNVGMPDAGIAAEFAAVYRSVDTGLPFTSWDVTTADPYGAIIGRAADGLQHVPAFAEPERRRFPWTTTVTKEDWLDQVPTSGGHHQMRPDVLRKLLAGLATVVDSAGGSFTMHYSTELLIADRTDP